MDQIDLEVNGCTKWRPWIALFRCDPETLYSNLSRDILNNKLPSLSLVSIVIDGNSVKTFIVLFRSTIEEIVIVN